MGDHQIHRRLFSSKSKRLKSLAAPSANGQPSTNGPTSAPSSHDIAECSVGEEDSEIDRLLAEPRETEAKELRRVAGACNSGRQLAKNQNFQEETTTVSHSPPETADQKISSLDMAVDSAVPPMRHIDDTKEGGRPDENEDEREQAKGQTGDHDTDTTRGRRNAEPPEEIRPARTISPYSHIEILESHPDNEQLQKQKACQRPHNESRRIRDSKLFRATKAILLFRRAASSLGHGDRQSSAAAHHHPQGGSFGRSFVSSFWRQNTADNSTCTRSSRLDSLASSNTNNNGFCSRSRSSFGFLNGTGKSSSQVSLNQRVRGEGRQHEAAPAEEATNSSFSPPRFIVPKMNALRLPIVCLIKSLEGELMREVFIHRYELGQYIMDNLKVSLGIKDAKYFGLKVAGSLDEQEDVRQPWLDLNESVYKQISKHSRVITIENVETSAAGQPARQQQQQQQPSLATSTSTTKSVDFYLRVKYYPPNLGRVQDPFLKQYLWLQLRRDLRLGKLTSSMNNLTYLMACVLQYELGDYNQELANDKMAHLNILPNQDLIERQATEIWQTRLGGTKRHLVLMQFLRASVILETYGFDYYPVRDHQRERVYLLGFNYAGVKTIRNGRIIHNFRWHGLSKISHERRMIIFHVHPDEGSRRKQILGFKCLSNEDCQSLYLRLLEQKYFFTMDLAYFDRGSVRGPSHLTESAVDSQLSDWSMPSSSEARQRTLDTDFSFGDDEDDCAGWHRRDEPPEDESTESRSARFKYAATEARPGGAQTTACVRPNCDCVDCEQRAPRTPRPGVRGDTFPASGKECAPSRITKSSSLQEATGCDSPDCRELELARYFSHSSSPETSPAGINDADYSNRGTAASMLTKIPGLRPPTPRASHAQAPLLRQRPVSKCAPDFGVMPRRGATDERHLTPPIPEGCAPPSGAPGATFPPAGRSGALTPRTAGQRLLDWTEQILVQPASLLSESTRWPGVSAQQNASSAAGTNLRGERRESSSATVDLLAQTLKFSLLVVMLNILLRLSDGISSVLIDLLTFGLRSQSHSATQP